MWDLVPGPGIEPLPSALGAQRLSHWTTRESPEHSLAEQPHSSLWCAPPHCNEPSEFNYRCVVSGDLWLEDIDSITVHWFLNSQSFHPFFPGNRTMMFSK